MFGAAGRASDDLRLDTAVVVKDGATQRDYKSIRKPQMTVGAANGKRGSGTTEFNFPMGVDVGAHGAIHIADHGNNRVQV